MHRERYHTNRRRLVYRFCSYRPASQDIGCLHIYHNHGLRSDRAILHGTHGAEFSTRRYMPGRLLGEDLSLRVIAGWAARRGGIIYCTAPAP
jgi:hypothetical protein